MLEFSNVKFAYGERLVLNHFSAAVPRGQVTGLLGVNGSGKTTLLRLVAGVAAQQSGNILLDSVPLSSYSRSQRARKVSYLSQRAQPAWDISAAELTELGALPYPEWTKHERQSAVEQAMAQTDCLAFSQRKVTELSAGELQRVLLARLLVGHAEFILADEPTNGLDPRHQLDTMACFQQLAQQGRTVLVVLHDLALASQFCDHLIFLHQGKVHAAGPTAEVHTPRNLLDVFSI
ncbi:ABC transporter ATP-binding protein [Aliidiomarina celeris]|uniref:ABC transporter ATP-binding protein n=1 Tax=Aliidiomarina celeris TaxID=2249428 RepID=UPI000DEB288C|nr:ABC transporter ATP-binding protein [Aliidiomarina celeris]